MVPRMDATQMVLGNRKEGDGILCQAADGPSLIYLAGPWQSTRVLPSESSRQRRDDDGNGVPEPFLFTGLGCRPALSKSHVKWRVGREGKGT